MSDMKMTRPDFPSVEVLQKMLAVIEPYSNDVRDVAGLSAVLAAYALRFAQQTVGQTLSQADFVDFCLRCYRGTDDKTAASILTGRVKH